MRYVSNLIAPDLRAHFKLKKPPVQIMGHDIPSDPDFEPECGFFSDDEAAILYHVAKQVSGVWIDVGARFGWTTAHIAEAGREVIAVDPQLCGHYERKRFDSNVERWRWNNRIKKVFPAPFVALKRRYTLDPLDGIVIDGCHDDPAPIEDAMRAHSELYYQGVILMHDFWGAPIQRAVKWLMDTGYKCRVYNTPNGIALCWRMVGFIPPEHVPDPQFNWKAIREQRCPEFDFSKCE